MKKLLCSRSTVPILVCVLLIPAFLLVTGIPAVQCEEPMAVETHTATIGPPVQEDLVWSGEMPVLTEEQMKKMDFCIENTHLPGPRLDRSAAAPTPLAEPDPKTESIIMDMPPLGPESATAWRKINFQSKIPSGYKSNVMESSVGMSGKYGFFTGNWFAARTTSGGKAWTYVNPYSGYSNFCCDQVSIYDESRDIFLWLRMGSPHSVNGNYENEFKLSVSNNNAASWMTYTFTPTGVNSTWTNQWWDYPHMQLGADNLYITWNMFNSAGSWTRSLVLRLPLDKLRTGAGFSYGYYDETSWFTLVPIQGADHVMYFASNWPNTAPQNSRIAIWGWYEDSGGLTLWIKTVAAWTLTDRGDALCGSTSRNWAARYDQRLLTGAKYTIKSTNLKIPGRAIIAWWWNVQEGGNYPRPYVDGAAFYEDTMAQVSGNQGRPFVWNSGACFAYPSVAADGRGDLGMVLNYGTSGNNYNPDLVFAIDDDFNAAAPGWFLNYVKKSNGRPVDSKWGDYNTCRVDEPSNPVWSGAAHYLQFPDNNSHNQSAPIYFSFGRERDRPSWGRWKNK